MPLEKLTTQEQMKEKGFRYQRATECQKCGAPIEWFYTPREKMLAVNSGTAEPHWNTSPGCFTRKFK